MKNLYKTNIPMGRITNIIGKCTYSQKDHERIYDSIAQDYAERHDAPYVHIFRDGKFVATIARKEK